MGIEKNIVSVAMRITSDYGMVDGKAVKKNHTYADIKSDVSDEALMSVYDTIAAMQAPTADGCQKITTESLLRSE